MSSGFFARLGDRLWRRTRREPAEPPHAGAAISYCIAVYRPPYARALIADLEAKTTARYEILLWLNVADEALDADIAAAIARGVPIRVIGRTPENIGMLGYEDMFRAARYPLITQIDDDVVCLSHGIAERAHRHFERFPEVRMIATDCWQDEFTTGARPPIEDYTLFDADEEIYAGPIDGWFAIYHRSILPILLGIEYKPYLTIGSTVLFHLHQAGQLGILDLRTKVFHVVGPAYASAFGMLDFEIEKQRRLGHDGMVSWYEDYRARPEPADRIAERVAAIRASIDAMPGD